LDYLPNPNPNLNPLIRHPFQAQFPERGDTCVTRNTLQTQAQPKTSRKRYTDPFAMMAYKRATQAIQILAGRLSQDGELPSHIQLETAWWVISEALAVNNFDARKEECTIDIYQALEYIRKRLRNDDVAYELFLESKELGIENIQQVCQNIEAKPVKYRLTRGEIIGRGLKLTTQERIQYKAYTMIAIDQSRAELKSIRKVMNRITSRACKAKKRINDGATPHALSATRTKPWEQLGISRRTWYNRGKPSPLPSADIIQLYPDK